jgi:threonine dehydrogenase-like Zn-dependent dehydrogenase
VIGLRPGDLVAVEYFSHCGECVYCHTGDYNHCVKGRWVSENAHGGFAEYSTVHASGVFKLPTDMSFEEGAFVEPLAVARRAVALSGATIGDRVAFIGGGTIGQLCFALAKRAGVKETFISVKYEQQARIAEVLGGDYVINVAAIDLIASGKIPVTDLITHRFALEDAPEAFLVAADKQSGALKVQIYQ